MIKVLFVCHGNICRSPMAEFVLKDMVKKRGIANQFLIESAATSREEIGNGVHPGTKKKLNELQISTLGKIAVQLKKTDYDKYDYLIGMDHYNITNMMKILGADPDTKIHLLLDYTDSPGSISDPWYTGDFEQTYQDVLRGCKGFLDEIL